jgi:hypothetical protein
MTLISEPSTALAVPTNAHVTLFKEDGNATTVNTDIMAWASRSKQTFTATNATNVLNTTAHGLSDNDRVMLSTTGTTTLQLMTNFDGTNDSLTRGGALTGAANSKAFTMSFWMRITGGDGTDRHILTDAASNWFVRLESSNHLRIHGEDVLGSTANLETQTTSTFLAGNLYHVAIEVDLAAGVANIYKNGVRQSMNQTTNTNTNMASFVTSNWYIGQYINGSLKFNGDLAQFYFLMGTRIDLTNSANLAKFITVGGDPVDMGGTGTIPSGGTPIIFLNNTFGTFQNNLGSGGNFTENGTLTQGTNITETDLPAGLSTEPIYHVVNKTADNFQVSATNGGSAVALTDDGTGTHSVRAITPVTLADESTYDVYDIVSGSADISGQPSGTDMELIVQTKNNKDVKIHGQSLQWS